MICEFLECNIADDYWCECIHCKRKLEGFMNAVDLNKMRICCQKIDYETEYRKLQDVLTDSEMNARGWKQAYLELKEKFNSSTDRERSVAENSK